MWGDDHTQLRSRPDPGVVPRGVDAGLTPLGVAAERDASLFVPPEAARGRPVPLMVTLHGAGGGRHPGGLGRFRDAADRGVALLLPSARGASWDVIVEGRFGTDVAVIDEALAAAFERIPIDPTAVALGGSSDGASYAISLGLANGGLFPFLIGASPGFVADAERRGTPDVFVSHGRHDPTSPIDRTSGEIVPALREDGYDVHVRGVRRRARAPSDDRPPADRLVPAASGATVTARPDRPVSWREGPRHGRPGCWSRRPPPGR